MRWSPWLICVLLLARPAYGLGPSDRLDRARVAFAALDFEAAERELSIARASSSQLTKDQKSELFVLSAKTAMASERWADGRAHLDALLEIDPAFAPPAGAWAPRWRQVLDAARAARPDTDAPVLSLLPHAPATAGQPLLFQVDARDPSGIASASARIGDQAIALQPVSAHTWGARIDATHVRAPSVNVEVIAHDTRGNRTAPTSFAIEVAAISQPESAGLTSKWWFWAAIGVVAVGGAAAGVAAASGGSDGGEVRGRVIWP